MAFGISLVGGQNGDEGKGKIVEYIMSILQRRLIQHGYSGRDLLLYRWQGGPNAGHTLVLNHLECDDKVVKLHQIGSGITSPSAYNLLGKGMFINPIKLLQEMQELRSRGIEVSPYNLGISSKAHMILEYNRVDDQVNFNLKEHTSTGNGIRQTARDKADRIGIRFIEFLDPGLMKDILSEIRFPEGFPQALGSLDDFVASYAGARDFLAPFAVLENKLFSDPRFKYQVGEGAQGMMLDIDDGQYPGITSSNPGLSPHRPNLVTGIYKMYPSSVGIGNRPFVSEMSKELSSVLVPEWHEFGTTTGKARHVGYFDLVAAKYAAECAHMDSIAGTCLDKLESIAKHGEELKVCVAYEVDGERFDEWDISFDRRDTLKRAKPVYESMQPWDQTVERDGKTLTPDAQRYVTCIEDHLKLKMVLIGTGPEHNDLIVRTDMFENI
ncbi:MAG: adenylosuccinate synthetase [Candidatus Woesearchaeota archaeon]|nr:adenylosuccinate synthetase [Candidatus Woesearchaeota archaeon]